MVRILQQQQHNLRQQGRFLQAEEEEQEEEGIRLQAVLEQCQQALSCLRHPARSCSQKTARFVGGECGDSTASNSGTSRE
jgi:hypothetical protein